jgi:DNA-binding IclR family transcriptional regulator
MEIDPPPIAEPVIDGETAAERSRSEVQSVRRACQLLDCLASDPMVPVSALELARRTGLNRTVVHRLLHTLTLDELIQDIGGGRYRLGARTVGLGMAYIDGLGLRRAAMPYAIALQSSIEGTPWVTSLAVRSGNAAVLIERLWKPGAPLDSLMDIGTRMPLRTSAAGRCLIAYEQPAYDASDDPQLEQRLEDIRASGGIEVSSNEIVPGMSAISAAILGRDGRAMGTVAISGLELEPHLSRTSEVADRLRRAAVAIAGVLR